MIYEFTYKGKKYTSATGEMPEVLSYTQGETVQVYFYVDDPQNNGMLFYYIFGAAGLAAVAILYMIVRKREKK